MMKRKSDSIRFQRLAMLSIVAMVILVMAAHAYAGPAEKVKILKISVEDQRAVVKMPDGKTRIIKPADELKMSSGTLRITEITTNKVVLDETTSEGTEKVIISMDDKNGQKTMGERLWGQSLTLDKEVAVIE